MQFWLNAQVSPSMYVCVHHLSPEHACGYACVTVGLAADSTMPLSMLDDSAYNRWL